MSAASSDRPASPPAPEGQGQLHGSAQADAESISQWEAAYLRFETPEQEIRKFTDRLLRMGAGQWPRDAAIVELFCGRGNGLCALHRLGFTRLEGIDLSRQLIEEHSGPGERYVADCRQLPFRENSKDIVIIQGGLHHLPTLPDDLDQTLQEIRRVLKPGGWVLVVEPWLTPFLSCVHAVCANPLARRLSPKLDALATMIHHEGHTYQQWLGRPSQIRALLEGSFEPERCDFRWGKLMFLGRKSAGMIR